MWTFRLGMWVERLSQSNGYFIFIFRHEISPGKQSSHQSLAGTNDEEQPLESEISLWCSLFSRVWQSALRYALFRNCQAEVCNVYLALGKSWVLALMNSSLSSLGLLQREYLLSARLGGCQGAIWVLLPQTLGCSLPHGPCHYSKTQAVWNPQVRYWNEGPTA